MLADAISHAYGLAVKSVEPRQSGYAAQSFDVHCTGGRFVAKVWHANPPGEAWARLCDSLHFLGVRGPLRTREGEPIFAGPLGPMCLQPFVSGTTPPDWPRWAPRTLHALGEFLAAVHDTSPPPGLAFDDLSVPPIKVDTEFGPAIATQSARLRRLLEAIDPAHRSPDQMVLCHTDPGGDNILVGLDGRLTLVDWDEAAVSFPEIDLVLVARDQPPSGEPLRHVAHGYGRPLRLDRLAFCMLRRYVGDALARVDRRTDRDGIIQWGVQQWERLDDALLPVKPVFM